MVSNGVVPASRLMMLSRPAHQSHSHLAAAPACPRTAARSPNRVPSQHATARHSSSLSLIHCACSLHSFTALFR